MTTATATTCEAALWRGAPHRCGSVSGLRVWHDEAGVLHSACRNHIAERQHRFPEAPSADWTETEKRFAAGDR